MHASNAILSEEIAEIKRLSKIRLRQSMMGPKNFSNVEGETILSRSDKRT
jgi:hypothetical protein